ncbi:DoxX family membrane protein [Flavobacterium sp. SUN052]|uniref:DoxX family membrane protein n=1 Tax=Flavobacterium sp. SUN052 TaxID=3002441 RepID=UPI00237E6EDE|nr:DoxX family membrane protein [Flavobacterium sp. SUN052]MEC4003615.1 DoxX family membrane protein [Flavobacterium sp. SUN052]
MKIATIIVRLLVGALMLFASLSYFFKFGEQPAPVGVMKTLMDGFMASKYILPLAKSVELICGLTIISGKFMKIGAVVLVPVTLNILLINVFMMPEGIPIAAALFLGNLFLIYVNWSSYKQLFTA